MEATRRRAEVTAEVSEWQARGDDIRRTAARARRYLPLVRRILTEEGVPASLAYLPMVESRFDPDAVSPRGAAGLWQLMPETARQLGLRVDAEVDERFDPVLSTRAAARYLAHLHRRFGDWHLAIAAYNAGETRVARELARTGADDFWSLVESGVLPSESRQYVPRFLAAAELLKADRHSAVEADRSS